MILASCRGRFDSDHRFDELQVRRYRSVSDLSQFEMLSDGDLGEAVRGRHVLVLVHGYRNPIRNVLESYEKLERELARRALIGEGHYDLVIGFLWPGFQTRVGFFPAVPWANRSAAYLRALVEQLNESAHTVDVQTHSLGARVALQALAFEREIFVDNLMLTAPAVDNESLEPDREFNRALRSCRRCIVYHSRRDTVLKLAYRVGSLDRALGDTGPENPATIDARCPDVFVVDCSAVVGSHGGYRHAAEVYQHWAQILAEGALERFTSLRPQTRAARSA
jgi:esterase/lipase superfamily enzyme